MTTQRITRSALFLSGLIFLGPALWAQGPGGKSSDEALDSLIEKLADPKPDDRPAAKQDSKPADDQKPSDKTGQAKPKDQDPAGAGKASGSKSSTSADPSAGDVPTKDKELDELLEKLGESRDEPSARERPRSPGGGAGEPGKPDSPGRGDKSKPGDKARKPDLQGQDKELDERLEEFAGKKKRKQGSDQEQGSGPLGDLVKQMREVEQKLGKPDTGEDTQAKQKQIVKQIETLIRQAKQSGSQSQMAMRKGSQQGQKPGEQKSDNTGANAGGAPLAKPGKPPERHAIAGGKDIWGHLPAKLRQEMDNVFKEEALQTKEDLIKRYYLSIAKQKLQRGE